MEGDREEQVRSLSAIVMDWTSIGWRRPDALCPDWLAILLLGVDNMFLENVTLRLRRVVRGVVDRGVLTSPVSAQGYRFDVIPPLCFRQRGRAIRRTCSIFARANRPRQGIPQGDSITGSPR